MKKIHPEVFRFYPNVDTKEPNRKYINNLTFWNKKIPKENRVILENIQKQCLDIFKSLEPLVEFGLTFNLWLTGGSVRDLLLGNGNLIKDLDILLSFNTGMAREPKLPLAKNFIKKSKFNFESEQMKKIMFRNESIVPFNHWLGANKIVKNYTKQEKYNKIKKTVIFDMFASALAQNFNITEIYFPKKINDNSVSESYMDMRLEGVIKINKDDWKWPVDILISKDGIDDFIGAFDIGICKAAIGFVKGSDLREQSLIFPETPEDLLKKIRFSPQFLKDSKQNEIIIDVSGAMLVSQLRHSCETHLKNVLKKYSWPYYIKFNGLKFHKDFDFDKFIETENILRKDKKAKIYGKEDLIIFDYIRSFFMVEKINENLKINEGLNIKIKNKI